MQIFAIKPGIDQALDLARKAFSECSEAIYELYEEYKNNMELPNLKLHYNQRNAFSLTVPASDANSGLPDEFIQVSKKGKHMYFTSKRLLSLNARLQDSKVCFRPF